MFTQHFMETVFPRPQYMQLYGATEICVFPMITSSDRVVSNAFTNTMTAIILAVLMCNLSVIVCTKIYKLSPIPIKKTDYPSRLVHINANICVFSFFPITLLSVIHNMGLLDISYIYTLLALCTFIVAGLSNTYLLWFLFMRRVRIIRCRKMRYPSMNELFIYGSKNSSPQLNLQNNYRDTRM